MQFASVGKSKYIHTVHGGVFNVTFYDEFVYLYRIFKTIQKTEKEITSIVKHTRKEKKRKDKEKKRQKNNIPQVLP